MNLYIHSYIYHHSFLVRWIFYLHFSIPRFAKAVDINIQPMDFHMDFILLDVKLSLFFLLFFHQAQIQLRRMLNLCPQLTLFSCLFFVFCLFVGIYLYRHPRRPYLFKWCTLLTRKNPWKKKTGRKKQKEYRFLTKSTQIFHFCQAFVCECQEEASWCGWY